MSRWILLVLALALIGVGGVTWWCRSDGSSIAWAGVLVRAGLMFAAIWIAWPQIESLRNRMSALVLGTILFLLLLVAARPRIFPLAAGAALAIIMISGILRRLSGSQPRRKE